MSLILYNQLQTYTGTNPTSTELNAAREAFNRAKKGDGISLPVPFTYGKVYRNGFKNPPSDKLPKAPIISQKDLKKILIDLPKPNTDLLLSGKTSSAITNPRDVVGSLLQQAKMTLNKKTAGKIFRKLGQRLNKTTIEKETKTPLRKNQKYYRVLIDITTQSTGKHSIFFTNDMIKKQKQKEQHISTPSAHINKKSDEVQSIFPVVFRRSNKPPYLLPLNGDNIEWSSISKQLNKLLNRTFKNGKVLTFPSPLYPKDMTKDIFFRVSSYEWQFLPENLGNLTGDGQFKFYITYNWVNPEDPQLYIVLKVHLSGRIVKNKTKMRENKRNSGKKAKSKPLNNMGSFCDDRFSNLRNIFADVYSNSGVLSDTPSVSFEKKMARSKKKNIAVKNLKLYNSNIDNAIAYWINEYYCRQAINLNTGIDAGWPNLDSGLTRYPFDPWTLQPAIPGSHREINYPNGLPGQTITSEANLVKCLPRICGRTRDFYAPQITNQLLTSSEIQGATKTQVQRRKGGPMWNIPFQPFGMSLLPSQVILLFRRLNMIIASPDLILLGQDTYDSAKRLTTKLVGNRLPALYNKNISFTVQEWQDLFNIYEFALYNTYRISDKKRILEPYPHYPTLPKATDNKPFGSWIVNNKGDSQWAIPFQSNMLPPAWSIKNTTAPQSSIYAVNNLPSVNARPKVTWQQISQNGFYQLEAKKWAQWMILAHPVAIPGFKDYNSYIVLLQKYRIFKLSQSAPLPVKNDKNNIVLTNPQKNTQGVLPNLSQAKGVVFGKKNNEWKLPAERKRSKAYTNVYCVVNQSISNGGIGLSNRLWSNHFRVIGRYSKLCEMLLGPPALYYPKEIWPPNNLRKSSITKPELKQMKIIGVRRVKRNNKEMGGWMGGKRKTVKKMNIYLKKKINSRKNMYRKTMKRRKGTK